MKTYNKLIRDKIPEVIADDNFIGRYKKLNKKEFKKALFEKIIEETAELSKTSNKADLIEELADLQEILLVLYENEKISVKEIEAVRKAKLKKRGGFTKRIMLLDMTPNKNYRKNNGSKLI